MDKYLIEEYSKEEVFPIMGVFPNYFEKNYLKGEKIIPLLFWFYSFLKNNFQKENEKELKDSFTIGFFKGFNEKSLLFKDPIVRIQDYKQSNFKARSAKVQGENFAKTLDKKLKDIKLHILKQPDKINNENSRKLVNIFMYKHTPIGNLYEISNNKVNLRPNLINPLNLKEATQEVYSTIESYLFAPPEDIENDLGIEIGYKITKNNPPTKKEALEAFRNWMKEEELTYDQKIEKGMENAKREIEAIKRLQKEF